MNASLISQDPANLKHFRRKSTMLARLRAARIRDRVDFVMVGLMRRVCVAVTLDQFDDEDNLIDVILSAMRQTFHEDPVLGGWPFHFSVFRWGIFHRFMRRRVFRKGNDLRFSATLLQVPVHELLPSRHPIRSDMTILLPSWTPLWKNVLVRAKKKEMAQAERKLKRAVWWLRCRVRWMTFLEGVFSLKTYFWR